MCRQLDSVGSFDRAKCKAKIQEPSFSSFNFWDLRVFLDKVASKMQTAILLFSRALKVQALGT